MFSLVKVAAWQLPWQHVSVGAQEKPVVLHTGGVVVVLVVVVGVVVWRLLVCVGAE